MAARGTRKVLEFQKSCKFRKVLCYGHGLGTVGVLACMFLFCSLFLDMRTFYHTSKQVHLQQELRSAIRSAPIQSVISPESDEESAITELNSEVETLLASINHHSSDHEP